MPTMGKVVWVGDKDEIACTISEDKVLSSVTTHELEDFIYGGAIYFSRKNDNLDYVLDFRKLVKPKRIGIEQLNSQGSPAYGSFTIVKAYFIDGLSGKVKVYEF